jgi:hypothetical protein
MGAHEGEDCVKRQLRNKRARRARKTGARHTPKLARVGPVFPSLWERRRVNGVKKRVNAAVEVRHIGRCQAAANATAIGPVIHAVLATPRNHGLEETMADDVLVVLEPVPVAF